MVAVKDFLSSRESPAGNERIHSRAIFSILLGERAIGHTCKERGSAAQAGYAVRIYSGAD